MLVCAQMPRGVSATLYPATRSQRVWILSPISEEGGHPLRPRSPALKHRPALSHPDSPQSKHEVIPALPLPRAVEVPLGLTDGIPENSQEGTHPFLSKSHAAVSWLRFPGMCGRNPGLPGCGLFIPFYK